jgi:hypothetical protein
MIDTSFIENLTKDLEKKVKGIQDAGSKRNIVSNDISAIDIDTVAFVDIKENSIILKNGGGQLDFNNQSGKDFINKVFEAFTKS